MKKVLYIQPRIEVVKIKEEYIMAEFTGAMAVKNGETGEGEVISTDFSGNVKPENGGAGLGAKRNFSIWEDDADDNMNW